MQFFSMADVTTELFFSVRQAWKNTKNMFHQFTQIEYLIILKQLVFLSLPKKELQWLHDQGTGHKRSDNNVG